MNAFNALHVNTIRGLNIRINSIFETPDSLQHCPRQIIRLTGDMGSCRPNPGIRLKAFHAIGLFAKTTKTLPVPASMLGPGALLFFKFHGDLFGALSELAFSCLFKLAN